MSTMIRCEYRFYRGSEWLEFRYSNEKEYIFGMTYKCYRDGNMFMEDGFKHDSEEKKEQNILHRVYAIMPDETLRLKYESSLAKTIV